MGLFGKSMEEQVNDALEKVRGQFPGANISATVSDKVVTLRGTAPDIGTKGAIMTAFNALVETENTINQISIPQAAAPAPPTMPPSMASASASAPGAQAAAGARTHDVVAGDTLSGLAKKYYGNASQYMKIFNANRDLLDDPDRIKVGQKLKIPE